MKIAPRIVSAALALTAIVGLPLVQPAHAAGAPDVEPEPASPAYQVFGQVFSSGPGQPPDMNAKVRSYYRIVNYGGGNSGNVLVITACKYGNKSVAPKTAYFIPNLPSGWSNLEWFDCARHAQYGMPDGSSITVRGVNEPQEKLNNNTASIQFKYIGDGAGS